MNKPEDYKRFGVNPDGIEAWEDGRRIESERGWWEWWYFDAILDDGTNVVVQFFTKSGATMMLKEAHPNFTARITLPDGSERACERRISRKKSAWSRTYCDVELDGNLFVGDEAMQNYHIFVKPDDSIGVDLCLRSLSKPYRPGSSYMEFGDPNRLYTWLCVVPKGEVTGTITIDGKPREVHGFGYHDHQWGNVNFMQEWNHWVWARQSFEDCSMIVFDFVSNERTEFTRLPIVFIQDSEGALMFESTEGVECEVLGEYHDEVSGKDYPSGFHYVFRDGGKTADYTLRRGAITECNGRNNMSFVRRTAASIVGVDPAYTRYAATGELVLTEDGRGESGQGGRTIRRSGDLIYEFMYPGKTYKGHI